MSEPESQTAVLVDSAPRPPKLAAEAALYRERAAEFERDHRGEAVAIKGDRVLGFWPDRDAALEAAFEIVGITDVLVRVVGEPTKVVDLTREII